jgi:hypothetical protein
MIEDLPLLRPCRHEEARGADEGCRSEMAGECWRGSASWRGATWLMMCGRGVGTAPVFSSRAFLELRARCWGGCGRCWFVGVRVQCKMVRAVRFLLWRGACKAWSAGPRAVCWSCCPYVPWGFRWSDRSLLSVASGSVLLACPVPTAFCGERQLHAGSLTCSDRRRCTRAVTGSDIYDDDDHEPAEPLDNPPAEAKCQ